MTAPAQPTPTCPWCGSEMVPAAGAVCWMVCQCGARSPIADTPSEALAAAARPAASVVIDEPMRPRIVCLCGSGRFREAFEQAEFNETLAGRIVLTIGCNTHDVARSADLQHHKPMLDELHLRKIDLADEVLVLNVGRYVGESTRREVEYARSIGKPIRWLEDRQ